MNLLKKWLVFALLVPFSISVSSAQESPNQSANPVTYNGAREIIDGAHLPPIPNASFSAKAELETRKMLADGTDVTQRTFNIIARDFRGRTHNEMRAWIPEGGSDAKLTYIVLYDPDTHLRTFIYPAMRLARRFVMKPQTQITSNGAPTIQKEDLGADFKEGLQLSGTRETRTYAPGILGNDRPINVTSEYWYSPELQVNVLVKRTDPRFGTQTVRLTNLSREEPDASLFDVPPDYKLVNEDGTMTGSPQAAPSPYRQIRLGATVQSAKILNRVQPIYPEEARKARIQGTVRLHVIIQKDGTLRGVEVVSGHPLLTESALTAVKQWRYEPTVLNGEPVEVDTTIDVSFVLNQPPASHP